MPTKPRAFISYSRKDGEAFARELHARIETENIPAWLDRKYELGGRDWWLQVTEALHQTEFLVLVMTPAALTSETVRREWGYARQEGVCVFPVKAVPDAELDYSETPRWMHTMHWYDLDAEWTKFVNDLNTRCDAPRVPFMVEDLPPEFVPREREFEQLTQHLLAENGENQLAITTALRGAGGYGKTTLARAVCHDDRIQEKFDDGILWVTLGENPGDATEKIKDWVENLSGERPGFATEHAISTRLAELLADRDVLLVIDDVWNRAHLQPFLLRNLPHCKYLITTRNKDTVPAKTSQVDVDAMREEEATQLLAFGLPDGEEEALRALAARLGECPQLLRLINPVLQRRVNQDGQSLAEALKFINKVLDKRGLVAFDADDPQARDQAFASTIGVSLDLLSTDERARYEELAIFPEDVAIPLQTVEKSWQHAGLDDVDTELLCEKLHKYSLLLEFDLNKRTILFHDVFRAYLMHEQQDNLPALHNRFLDAYQTASWPDLSADEPYLWTHLAHHLSDSRQDETLRKLLFNYDWLDNKLRVAGVNALLADYDYFAEDEDCRLLQRALRLSADQLTRDSHQLPSQLIGRLKETSQYHIQKLVEQTREKMRGCWLRPLTASLAAERSIRWLRPMQRESLHSVVFSPNGLWAAHVSGSFGPIPRAVVLWNLKEWQSCGPRFQTLTRLNPFALALSNDARWCLYADSVGGVHRLDALGDEVWDGHAHRDLTIAMLLAISSDGRRALSACQHGRLVAWDIDAGRHEVVYDESDNYIEALGLDVLGNSGVVARRDGSIDLLNLWPARQRALFKLNGRPSALARSSDNSVVAVATVDGRIEVRSVASLEPPISTFATQERPTSVALSSDHRYLAVGTANGQVEVWNIESGARCAQYSDAHTYEVERIVFSHNSARVVSADGLQIKEWPLEASDEGERGSIISRATGQVKVTADGLRAVAVLDDGRLGVWSIYTGALESALPWATGPAFGDPDIGPPVGLALAPNALCVLAWNEKLLCVWDLGSSARVRSLSVADTRDAAITPDGNGVVYVNGLAVTQWKPDEDMAWVLGTYDGDPPGHVTISPDGQRALTSGGDRRVFEWRIDAIHRPSLPEPLARRIAWSNSWWPDSRDKPSTIAFTGPEEAVVTTGDGSMFMLRMSEKEPERFAGRHGAFVNRLLVTNNGRFVVTSSHDQKIMMWHLGTRRRIAEFDAHPGDIEQLSKSGQRALLSTFDGVKIVSLLDGSLIAAFQADKQIITCAADAELRCVVACDQGGQMHFLHVEDGT